MAFEWGCSRTIAAWARTCGLRSITQSPSMEASTPWARKSWWRKGRRSVEDAIYGNPAAPGAAIAGSYQPHHRICHLDRILIAIVEQLVQPPLHALGGVAAEGLADEQI